MTLYTLKAGQGFYEFYGIPRPALPFERRERPPLQGNAGDVIVEIQDLHKKMGTPPPKQDRQTVVQQGVNVSGIYVVPKGKGMHYGIGAEGELVQTKNDYAEDLQPPGVLDPEYDDIDIVTDLEEEATTETGKSKRQAVFDEIVENPDSITGVILYQYFTDTNGVWDVYPGTITGSGYDDDGAPTWRVNFDMNCPERILTEQEIMHHVVDSYVTCVHGDPSQQIRGDTVLDQMRTDVSAMAFAKTSADMRIKSIKPGGWAPHRINSEPFAHLRQNNDKVISIHERRNCRWGSTLPELKNLEVSTYLSRKGTNFVHACDDMGIEVKHRRLYYN